LTLPVPEPGLVIRYSYLWRSDHDAGHEQSPKARPAVIVLAVTKKQGEPTRVLVSPITHTDPGFERGLEIPPKLKSALGLDEGRSWIVTDDINAFEWPGYDLEQIPGMPGKFAYGYLPRKLFYKLRDAILAHNPLVQMTRRN
jgi:hypothetical protein